MAEKLLRIETARPTARKRQQMQHGLGYAARIRLRGALVEKIKRHGNDARDHIPYGDSPRHTPENREQNHGQQKHDADNQRPRRRIKRKAAAYKPGVRRLRSAAIVNRLAVHNLIAVDWTP